MFYRIINEDLKKWKNTERKPLIVRGLRQVGKTTSILNFCKENYENVIYIDFRNNETYKEIFEGDFDIDRITSLISTKIEGATFVPNKTVIFFDEVQECSKARASLKYFYIDKRYDVICSGSLLGIRNYNQDFSRSVSVGFETFLTMYPMNFKEYLMAKNKKALIPFINKALDESKEIEPFIHEQLLNLFREYLVVGGMPEIVSKFLETNNYDQVFTYQSDLLNTYRDDFGRNISANNVVGRDTKLFERIMLVYESIPQQLAKENNKFKYSSITKGARSSTFYDAIEWLKGAGLIYKIKNLNTIEIPFNFNQIQDQFKLYFADSGLLMPFYGKSTQEILLKGNSGVYKGAIYENMVASLLIKNKITPFYYQKANRLEVDFAIESKNYPIAIEVKATNSKSKSLTILANSPSNYGQENLRCIKFYEKNISYNSSTKILNLPYYLIDFINFDTIINSFDKNN